MHTVLTRLNALAAYTMSVLAAPTMACFLSDRKGGVYGKWVGGGV